jgi:hypothetical protein
MSHREIRQQRRQHDESRWIGFAPDDDGRCIGNDPMCPCQDGDACHYRDAADGTKGWPLPDWSEQQEDEGR